MLKISTYVPEVYPDLIERIWILENVDNDVQVMIPPNQYCSIIIPLQGSMYYYNGKPIEVPQLEGISLQSSSVTYPKGAKILGIRFFPYALYTFFNMLGKDVINNSVSTSLSIPPSFSDVISDLSDHSAIVEQASLWISAHFQQERYDKATLLLSYYQYFRNNDQAGSIEEFCERFHTSYATLNRHFTKYIGITPKRFERLIKFRKSLCSLMDTSDKLTSIGMNSGYFDQAHFIREFKLFMNHSPSTYNSLIKAADKETNIINYNFNIYGTD
ncbi:AraC family transcriptional regulator [Puteibacter caeruleilacunae]|nr:AraC family transcriptional regulator [Puteibacter caeruleilacunae]